MSRRRNIKKNLDYTLFEVGTWPKHVFTHLFLHALHGCDTTLRLSSAGKAVIMKTTVTNSIVQRSIVRLWCIKKKHYRIW